MKQLLFRLKVAITATLLISPFWAIGQDQTSVDCFIDYGNPTIYSNVVYYKYIPNRFFIQKSSDVSQDYIVSLLERLSGFQLEVVWCSTDKYQDNLCRVIIDDELIDNLISEVIKDNGVLTARRIYAEKDEYDNYLVFAQQSGVEYKDYIKDPNLRNKELFFFNEILGFPFDFNTKTVPTDSICEALGMTYEEGTTFINFTIPKNADIFKMSNELLATGYFMGITPERILPYYGMSFDNTLGCKVNQSDHFFFYSDYPSKRFLCEIQDRLFIQTSEKATQDYINALINSLIDCEYEQEWISARLCRLTVSEAKIDSLIKQLIKDDSVLVARRIYVSKDSYEADLYYPNLKYAEEWILNDITCYFKDNNIVIPKDSICNKLGLTIYGENDSYVNFKASKQADIFEVTQKLFETGYFSEVYAIIETPFATYTTDVYPIKEITNEAQETSVQYFDLLGHKVAAPSGLTIVVKRYSDGTVRTEKILFR